MVNFEDLFLSWSGEDVNLTVRNFALAKQFGKFEVVAVAVAATVAGVLSRWSVVLR